MPFTYTNRKGFIYHLCQAITKTDKTRYYFAREPQNIPVEKMPDGYQVDESVNGIVSLVKARPQLILSEELVIVESALKKHPQSRKYRATVKDNKIIVHESQGADFGEILAGIGWSVPDSLEQGFYERYARFSPIMRFILEDAEGRVFSPHRWCFRGGIDGWINAGNPAKIDALVKKLLPKLGTDDFYELY